ncbi:hypothetical protein MRX96_057827 [Rhipicephalus microplus]
MVSGDRRSPKEGCCRGGFCDATSCIPPTRAPTWNRPALPATPSVEDHKVIFRIRGGISLNKKRFYPCALLYKPRSEPPLPMRAWIRVRKERNIVLVSTSDPDLSV